MNTCPKCNKPLPEGSSSCPSCNKQHVEMNPEVAAHMNLLKKKIAEDPSNAKLHIDLGDLYHRQAMLEDALGEYQKAVDIEPENYHALVRSARMYLRSKQLTRAEKAFRAALHINPRSTTSLIGLFRIYYLSGKTDESIVLGEKIIKTSPDNLEFHMLLKNLYKRKGNKKKTLEELRKIETLVPDNAEVLKETLLFFLDEDHTAGITEYYGKLLDKNLVSSGLQFKMGKYYYDKQDLDRSAEILNGLLKQGGLTPELRARSQALLALTHYARGNMSETEKIMDGLEPPLREHLDNDVKNKLAEACYTCGRDELKNGNRKRAKRAFERALDLDPESHIYRDALNDLKETAFRASKKTLIKAGIIAGSIAAACVIIILIVSMTRNKIFMKIEPSHGLTVIVNGTPVPVSPEGPGIISTPAMGMGTYDIEISKPGYETWQGSVDIPFGRPSRMDLTLVPVYFSLRVLSVPDSVEVMIDGGRAGSTPFEHDSLLAYSHTVTLQQRGYMMWDTVLTPTGKTMALDTVFLKNLAGKWQGTIGENSFDYNAAFDMDISQSDTVLTVRFNHRPSDDNSYNGRLKGYLDNNRFYVTGSVTNKYYKVFYWAQEKRNIALQGRVSDDWDRIAGEYQIEGTAQQSWQAVRTQ